MTARPRLLLLFALVCLVATACGGSDDEPTVAAPTTAVTPACADVAGLRKSITDLDQLDVPDVGKAGLQAALQNVRTSLDALKRSAGSQWGTQVDELDGAIDEFQTTVTNLDGDSLLGDLPAIVRNLERIDTAWTTLEREIDQTCPKP
jgi:hypothetical protein